MKHFIIASHGSFSKELIKSAELIMGEKKGIDYLCMEANTCSDEIRAKLNNIIKNRKDGDEIIILTDVLGGSISNICTEYVMQKDVHIVTGVNMPMVLNMLTSSENVDTEKLIEETIKLSRDGIKYLNKMIKNNSGSIDN